MKRLSEGKKDVNGFIKYVYPKYRNHKANIPLLKELNNYMENYKMDYFFDEYVKKTSYFYPIYDDFINKYKNLKIDTQIIRIIDGYDLTNYQEKELVKILNSMNIKDKKEIDEKIDDIIKTMEEYKKLNLDIIPKEIIELSSKIPGEVQYLMYMHQKSILSERH
jgi:hypothetical protein